MWMVSGLAQEGIGTRKTDMGIGRVWRKMEWHFDGKDSEKFGVEFGMGKGKREKYDSSIHSPHAHVGFFIVWIVIEEL